MKCNLLVIAAGAVLALIALVTPAKAGWLDDAEIFDRLFGDGSSVVVAEYNDDGGFRIEDEDGNIFFGCQAGKPCDELGVPLYLPAIQSGATPSVNPGACSPFEDCHIGEREPNTHEGAWWPTDE